MGESGGLGCESCDIDRVELVFEQVLVGFLFVGLLGFVNPLADRCRFIFLHVLGDEGLDLFIPVEFGDVVKFQYLEGMFGCWDVQTAISDFAMDSISLVRDSMIWAMV